ncbi:ARM repeat-containing protein [Suhomyces tanzawaensis NRRL Y-17324]|uniref:ARM repeat-containing protein n=1 Tax=Suhomyces tanzawaensis NRRL Y-17324 TaxID=984487 RepID=A0A1E4SP55_9ASCO|nr:ARM repeat-containing protein [Suhomyces tanzawaensis NRRL Y-17324]ODV81276.1 ARM repeat-containing protein [Suhomyces tanzawaensis NRRL Y-17324]
MSLLQLIQDQTSPDNSVRVAAELNFNHASHQNPSQMAHELTNLASSNDTPIDIRQASLLHLKRLVPKYWSMGFQSFVGPPVDQETKEAIRQTLIDISLTTPYSKVRSGTAYAIVQIASADYPDEWPQLMNQLYQGASNSDLEYSMIGALTVLNDLFDDLVTEEQFWDGGVGIEITNHIMSLLTRNLDATIKTSAIKLYQNVLNTLQSPEAFTPQRKAGVIEHINSSIVVFTRLLEESIAASSSGLNQVYLRSHIYRIIGSILGSFDKKVNPDIKKKITELCLQDFGRLAEFMHTNQKLDGVFDNETDMDPANLLIDLLNLLLQSLLIVQQTLRITDYISPESLYESVKKVSILSEDLIQDYEADLTLFVSDMTGLSTNLTTRDPVHELLSELNDHDSAQLFKTVLRSLSTNSENWKVQEADLFLLECLFTNDDSEIFDNQTSLTDLLGLVTGLISYEHSFITARCFLMLPKFFEKFSSQISVPSFGLKTFIGMIEFSTQGEPNDIIRMSSLMSLTLYKNFTDFGKLLEPVKKNEIQLKIFQLVNSLIEESEDDGLTSLLEAITFAIDVDPLVSSKLSVASGVNVIDLIFKISFKDASNVQLTIDSTESLSTLLSQISIDDYIVCCEKSLPFIINLIDREVKKGGNVEYTPDLYLSLELLSIIIDSFPSEKGSDSDASGNFPPQIFNYVFPTVRSLLLSTTDNQILQSGGEVFNAMIKEGWNNFLTFQDESNESGMTSLLRIVSKFLSPELSDSAAMNCGLIVLSLLQKFQSYLDQSFLSQLLEATVNRLVLAQEPVTIENLIMVFCNLVLNSPSEMIDLLVNQISVQDAKTNSKIDGLSAVLPIWFESFEVTRGYEKIKQNVLALGKIFTLDDKRVQSLIVNGDIIPYQGDLIRTRSMAKSMPDQYTQIPASQKILKLLISELSFQCQQPEASDYFPEVVDGEDDGEGWEDMDDIGVPNYEKLKSYVDSDDEDESNEDHASGDDSLLKILVQFFRECTMKNLGNFQAYYELLDDDEKRTVTENVVFE